MINVRDYAVTINGETIVPTKHRTCFGTTLDYGCTMYTMDKYEEDHASDANIISHIKSEVKYNLM